jgi:hypothetical protein
VQRVWNACSCFRSMLPSLCSPIAQPLVQLAAVQCYPWNVAAAVPFAYGAAAAARLLSETFSHPVCRSRQALAACPGVQTFVRAGPIGATAPAQALGHLVSSARNDMLLRTGEGPGQQRQLFIVAALPLPVPGIHPAVGDTSDYCMCVQWAAHYLMALSALHHRHRRLRHCTSCDSRAAAALPPRAARMGGCGWAWCRSPQGAAATGLPASERAGGKACRSIGACALLFGHLGGGYRICSSLESVTRYFSGAHARPFSVEAGHPGLSVGFFE